MERQRSGGDEDLEPSNDATDHAQRTIDRDSRNLRPRLQVHELRRLSFVRAWGSFTSSATLREISSSLMPW